MAVNSTDCSLVTEPFQPFLVAISPPESFSRSFFLEAWASPPILGHSFSSLGLTSRLQGNPPGLPYNWRGILTMCAPKTRVLTPLFRVLIPVLTSC